MRAANPAHSPRPDRTHEPLGWLSALVLIILVCAGLALRLAYLRGHYFMSADGCVFAAVGRNLLAGRGISANGEHQPLILPLMPLLMALVSRLLGGMGPAAMERAGHGISLLAGLLAAIPFGALARRWGGTVATWVAVGLFLLNAHFLLQMTEVVPEPLFILCYALAIWAAWHTLTTMRHGWAFLCGVVIALSYLLRGEAVAFIPVFGLVLLIAAVARRIRARSILGLLVALILGWLIPSTPYLVWVHDVSGKWQLSAKTDYNLQVIARVWGSDNPLDLERTLFGVNRQDVLAPSGQSAVRFAVAHRHEMTGLYLSNLLRIAKLAGAILKWWGLGLAGLGVLVLLLQRGRRLAVALLIASAVPMAALPLFHVEERYLYAYIALAQVLAGCGAGWLASLMLQRVSRPFTRHAASFLIAAIVLGGLAFHAKHALKEAVTPGDLAWEHRALGYYIRDYLPGVAQPGGPAIASRLPWVAFYADRENFEYLPFVDTIEELQPACEKFNIGWVVIDGRLVPRLNPALAPLIDPRKAPDWLQPLVRLPSNPPIVLYRVMKQGSSM